MKNKILKICPCCNSEGFVSSDKVFKKKRMTKKGNDQSQKKTKQK